MQKRNLLLIVIVSLIVLGFGASLIYWFQFVRPLSSVSEEEAVDLCAEFTKIEGEVSCEEATKLAIEKYPGLVKNIGHIDRNYLACGD